MRLDPALKLELFQLRRELHRHPEPSGAEFETAERIGRFFTSLSPDRSIIDLGGHGRAFIFSGGKPGPTILLRCELDALPIHEPPDLPDRSENEGVSHKCGHDGHMTILAAVGAALSRRRPRRGRVVLLYQPAEETGAGAAAVVSDPAFAELEPDHCFALHNLPGYPLGEVLVRGGTFCCASRGVVVSFRGRSAHAAQPETGISPARAMTALIEELGQHSPPLDGHEELAFTTVVGARLGDRAFGVAPAEAEVFATLRSESDQTMDRMVERVRGLVERLASRDQLEHSLEWHDVFPATHNTPRGAEIVTRAAQRGRRPVRNVEQPFRWSEDFGRYPAREERAMFGLGAGVEAPALHDPRYVFPEELIEIGAEVFGGIIDEILKREERA